MLSQVVEALPQNITAVVSDGQVSIRNAVAQVLPGTPHQLCHYHYYKEAFKPIIEADRHAKKELKKLVRGVRPLSQTKAYFRAWSEPKCGKLVGVNSGDEVDSSSCNHSRQ